MIGSQRQQGGTDAVFVSPWKLFSLTLMEDAAGRVFVCSKRMYKRSHNIHLTGCNFSPQAFAECYIKKLTLAWSVDLPPAGILGDSLDSLHAS
jgi:hypothetical protein